MESSSRISQRTTRIQCNIHASTYSVYRISSLSECNGFRAWERELACEGIRHVRTCMFLQCDLKEIVPEILSISPSMNVLGYKRTIWKLNGRIALSRKTPKDKIRISQLFRWCSEIYSSPGFETCCISLEYITSRHLPFVSWALYIYWNVCWKPEFGSQQTQPSLENGSVNTWWRYWASICCYATTVSNRHMTIATVAHATTRELP